MCSNRGSRPFTAAPLSQAEDTEGEREEMEPGKAASAEAPWKPADELTKAAEAHFGAAPAADVAIVVVVVVVIGSGGSVDGSSAAAAAKGEMTGTFVIGTPALAEWRCVAGGTPWGDPGAEFARLPGVDGRSKATASPTTTLVSVAGCACIASSCGAYCCSSGKHVSSGRPRRRMASCT